jgi:O-antigen/teichoic acid export membrane protein
MSGLSCLLLVAIRGCPFSPWVSIEAHLFFLMLITVPTFYLINFLRRILSGQLRITLINVSEIIAAVTNFISLILFVIIFELGIVGAIYAFISSQVLVMLFLVYHCYWPLNNVPDIQSFDAVTKENQHDDTKSKSGLAYNLWCYARWNYLVMLVNFLLDQLPFFILPRFVSAASIGFFSKPRNLALRTRVITESFSKMLFPYTAASKAKEATARTNMLCRTSLIAMTGFTLILAATAKYLILILFGEKFLPSVPVFYAISPVIVLWPISQFLGVHVAAAGSPKVVFMTSLGGLITSILLCILLIPVYGEMGAAFCVCANFFVLVVLRLVAYMKLTGAPMRKILIPQKSDWVYVCNLAKRLPPSTWTNGTDSGVTS